MKAQPKMLRSIGTFVLVLALLLQTMSALACTLISSHQASHNRTASCCTERPAPFQTPKGMPPEQCCLKTGPLLGKAAVPDALEVPQFVGHLESFTFQSAPADGPVHTTVEIWLASSSPPSPALLSVFRI